MRDDKTLEVLDKFLLNREVVNIDVKTEYGTTTITFTTDNDLKVSLWVVNVDDINKSSGIEVNDGNGDTIVDRYI